MWRRYMGIAVLTAVLGGCVTSADELDRMLQQPVSPEARAFIDRMRRDCYNFNLHDPALREISFRMQAVGESDDRIDSADAEGLLSKGLRLYYDTFQHRLCRIVDKENPGEQSVSEKDEKYEFWLEVRLQVMIWLQMLVQDNVLLPGFASQGSASFDMEVQSDMVLYRNKGIAPEVLAQDRLAGVFRQIWLGENGLPEKMRSDEEFMGRIIDIQDSENSIMLLTWKKKQGVWCLVRMADEQGESSVDYSYSTVMGRVFRDSMKIRNGEKEIMISLSEIDTAPAIAAECLLDLPLDEEFANWNRNEAFHVATVLIPQWQAAHAGECPRPLTLPELIEQDDAARSLFEIVKDDIARLKCNDHFLFQLVPNQWEAETEWILMFWPVIQSEKEENPDCGLVEGMCSGLNRYYVRIGTNSKPCNDKFGLDHPLELNGIYEQQPFVGRPADEWDESEFGFIYRCH